MKSIIGVLSILISFNTMAAPKYKITFSTDRLVLGKDDCSSFCLGEHCATTCNAKITLKNEGTLPITQMDSECSPGLGDFYGAMSGSVSNVLKPGESVEFSCLLDKYKGPLKNEPNVATIIFSYKTSKDRVKEIPVELKI